MSCKSEWKLIYLSNMYLLVFCVALNVLFAVAELAFFIVVIYLNSEALGLDSDIGPPFFITLHSCAFLVLMSYHVWWLIEFLMKKKRVSLYMPSLLIYADVLYRCCFTFLAFGSMVVISEKNKLVQKKNGARPVTAGYDVEVFVAFGVAYFLYFVFLAVYSCIVASYGNEKAEKSLSQSCPKRRGPRCPKCGRIKLSKLSCVFFAVSFDNVSCFLSCQSSRVLVGQERYDRGLV